MLNRQKMALTMVDAAGGQTTRLQLMKLMFLAGRECGSCSSGYYEFVPYHYGPYSFALQHELRKLTDQGLLEEDGNQWRVTTLGATSAKTLAKRSRAEVTALAIRYASRSVTSLVNYVYSEYPGFTVNSKQQKRRAKVRVTAVPAIYTVGYEGRSVDGLLDALVSAGVRALLDVRANPVARRFGFHRSTLERLCGKLDIRYRHEPELGISSKQRSLLDGMKNRDALLNLYDYKILPRVPEAVARVAEWMCEEPTALMCMEADPATCHRSRLARDLATRTGLDIRHIGWDTI